MHRIQTAILRLLSDKEFIPLKLRSIAREIGEQHPQTIKYHLNQLESNGLIYIDLDEKKIFQNKNKIEGESFASLPIMGHANCGIATSLANDSIEGFLKISKGLLNGLNIQNLFVLIAKGDSMNKSNVEGKQIDDGDFIIIDKNTSNIANKDYIVSIIEGCANIKRLLQDPEKISLISESTKDYPPIFISEHDDYFVSGKVVKVIKKPSLNL